MASIGFATLEIIPSLKGVTEAIEKQISGKTVKVNVEASVDQRAAQKAGKEAGEAVSKQAKDAIRKGDIGKTVHDEIKSSAKSSPAKEAAKAIVDGIADGVKKELPGGRVSKALIDGIADGVKQGIDGVGIGGQVVDKIGSGIKSGNLGETLKDALIPAVKNIGNEIKSSAASWAGDIGNALRSGDIQGATDQIGKTVQETTDLISDIGDTFGLQLDGVREFGNQSATTLATFGTNIQNVVNTATGINSTFGQAATLLETVLPAKAGAGAAGIARALGAVAVPAWLLYLVAQDRSGRQWGNGDPVSAVPNSSDFTPGQRSNNEILYGPYLGPWLDRTLGVTPPGMPNIPGGGGPNAQRERRGYGVGGYTGSMSSDMVAGVVHGGEYVINARSTAGIERSMPGLLGYLNNLPGYEGGGKVQLGNISAAGITTKEQQSMWDAVRGKFPDAVLTSATRTVMTEGHPDFHNAGRAIDISGPGMGSIASWIASNYPDSLELIHSPFGRNIKNGKSVGDGMSFYGAGLMAAHQNHVHWALGKMASAVTNSAETSTEAKSGDMSIGSAISAPSMSATGDAMTVATPGGQSSSINFASSFSGLAGTGLDKINPKTKVSEKSPERTFDIGGSIAAAAGGQVSSLLGVAGINDSPGWLRGLAGVANWASGVNDSVKSAMAPVSATTSGSSAGSALDNIHTGTGKPPGDTVIYNIQTTDIEPAYLASQRRDKERALANMASL